jgi:hypothetical protein
MTPLTYTNPHQQQQNGDDQRPRSISPPSTEKPSRVHSIARSTGAPIIVPDDRIYRTTEQGPPSTVGGANIPRTVGPNARRQEDAGAGGGGKVTILDPREVAPASEAPIMDGHPTDRPPGMTLYTGSSKPWELNRTGTQEMKLPGQFPVGHEN